MNRRVLFWVGVMCVTLACNFGIESPTPQTNLLATLAASTPLGGQAQPANGQTASPTATSAFDFPTPQLPTSTPFTPQLTVSAVNPPVGQIVFTCQVFKTQAQEQICVVNADGSNPRRLTTNDNRRHHYPAFAPDGGSVIYSAQREGNYFDLYEMNLKSNAAALLTQKKLGNIVAPDISPDGKYILFSRWNPNLSINAMYIVKRNGDEVERFGKIAGWNPSWSPDGNWVVFTSNEGGGTPQLYVMAFAGKQLNRISNLAGIREWSDWSPDGKSILTDAGAAWQHDVYIMNADGSAARVLTPTGGNAQEAAFSPDGNWVVFSAYYDHAGDEQGCELYILRVDGTDLRRLTNNDYCDYQPRWGP